VRDGSAKHVPPIAQTTLVGLVDNGARGGGIRRPSNVGIGPIDTSDSFVGGLGNANNGAVVKQETEQGPGAEENKNAKEANQWHAQHGVPQSMRSALGIGKDILVLDLHDGPNSGRIHDGNVLVGAVQESHANRRDEHQQATNADQKGKEHAIISFANAISRPRAMMIKSRHANIARIAVFGSGRSKDVASAAISVSNGPSHHNGFFLLVVVLFSVIIKSIVVIHGGMIHRIGRGWSDG